MKRQIIVVDLTQQEGRLDELRNALAEPKAKIISSVEADNKAVYVVETP